MKRLATLVALATALGGCARSQQGRDNILHLATTDDVKSFDPQDVYDEISWSVLASIHEAPLEYDYGAPEYRLTPLVAAQMPEILDRGRRLRLKLKKGIAYHAHPDLPAGRTLKAQDFETALKRLADPRIHSQGFFVVDKKVQGIDAFRRAIQSAPKESQAKVFASTPISGVKVVDEHTLEISLTDRYPLYIYNLVLPFFSPTPLELVDAEGRLKGEPTGTGPFKFESYRRGNRLKLAKNDRYWAQGVPHVKAAEIEIIKEQQPIWLRFLKGEVDFSAVPKESFQDVVTDSGALKDELKQKGIALYRDGGSTFWFLEFNLKDPLLGPNKLLRQAIACAIPREELIKTFFVGRGKKSASVVPPGVAGRPAHPALRYDFDLSRARVLLERAGYPGGKGLPPLKLDMRAGATFDRQLGDFFTTALKAVGISVEVVLNTFPGFVEKQRQAQTQMAWGGWILDYPDAESAFQIFFGPHHAPGPNYSNFHNVEFDRLYRELLRTEPGAPSRAPLIQKMDALVQEEVPVALLYDQEEMVLVQPWVKNFRARRMIASKLKHLDL